MNNEYIFYPNIDIDIDKLKSIVYRHFRKPETNLAPHQRSVSKEPYLVEMRNKYPWLSDIYNIFLTSANYVVPIHIDKIRNCSLNIPIQYTEDSYTICYETGNNPDLSTNAVKVYDVVLSEVKEVFRYTLDRPVIMNTKVPHSVIGGPEANRIIMSWSVSSNYSYEEMRKMLSVGVG